MINWVHILPECVSTCVLLPVHGILWISVQVMAKCQAGGNRRMTLGPGPAVVSWRRAEETASPPVTMNLWDKDKRTMTQRLRAYTRCARVVFQRGHMYVVLSTLRILEGVSQIRQGFIFSASALVGLASRLTVGGCQIAYFCPLNIFECINVGSVFTPWSMQKIVHSKTDPKNWSVERQTLCTSN